MITIAPATKEIVRQFYGEQPMPAMRAFVALDGDRPVAVAGLHGTPTGDMMLFSSIAADQDRSRHGVTIYKTAKRLLSLADARGWNVFACPSCEVEAAERFLRRIGFEDLGNGLYRRPSHG